MNSTLLSTPRLRGIPASGRVSFFLLCLFFLLCKVAEAFFSCFCGSFIFFSPVPSSPLCFLEMKLMNQPPPCNVFLKEDFSTPEPRPASKKYGAPQSAFVLPSPFTIVCLRESNSSWRRSVVGPSTLHAGACHPPLSRRG